MKRRALLANTLAVSTAGMLTRIPAARAAGAQRIFDCHAHFYTNQPDKYPFDAHSARYGAERMIAKAMANPMTPEAVFSFWEKAGIERGLGVQYSSTYFTDNRYLLDIAAEHPGKIVPIVILDATAAETPATLARMAKENHIAGVRFMGSADRTTGQFAYLTDAATPAWEICNELGLSITLMPLGGAPGAALPRRWATTPGN